MKRTFDIVVSSILLIIAAPLMLVIALGIKLTSLGPVIFRQKRVGQDGRVFMIYKFRTLLDDAVYWKRHSHVGRPRVTTVGWVIRRVKLDELPQLINVLRGDMSLVGPRPYSLYDSWRRKDMVSRYPERFTVKPGLVSPGKVFGRTFTEEMQQDVNYALAAFSLIRDLHIILSTPLAIARGAIPSLSHEEVIRMQHAKHAQKKPGIPKIVKQWRAWRAHRREKAGRWRSFSQGHEADGWDSQIR